MSALTKMVDQTIFLIEKQKESCKYTVEAFKNFLAAIQKMQEGKQDQESRDTLQEVYNAVADQSEQYSSEIEEDISFLDAQLETMQTVAQEGDEVKSAELVRVLTDGEELPETKDFKEEVTQEATEAKGHFLAVIADLMGALEEESFDDLLAYVEQTAIAEGQEEEEGSECCGGKNEACCGEDAAPERAMCCGGKGDCGDACVCNEECGCA